MKPSEKNNSLNPMNNPTILRKRVGLGTVIQVAVAPVAKVVGKSGCAACRRRAAKLNSMVPNLNPFAR